MAVTEEDSYSHHNKGCPLLRTWELNGMSMCYEHLLAAPSDRMLQHYWTVWAAIALFAALFVLVVLVSVVSSRKVRQHFFNGMCVLMCVRVCVVRIVYGQGNKQASSLISLSLSPARAAQTLPCWLEGSLNSLDCD